MANEQNVKHCHHIGPVSLCFPNWVENTVMITKQQHDLTHETLDISPKTIRSFRLKTNHLIFKPNVYYVQELCKLQNLYFARVPALPKELQEIHTRSMKALCYRACSEYGYDIPKDAKGSTLQQFKYWLGQYHYIILDIVQKQQ